MSVEKAIAAVRELAEQHQKEARAKADEWQEDPDLPGFWRNEHRIISTLIAQRRWRDEHNPEDLLTFLRAGKADAELQMLAAEIIDAGRDKPLPKRRTDRDRRDRAIAECLVDNQDIGLPAGKSQQMIAEAFGVSEAHVRSVAGCHDLLEAARYRLFEQRFSP